MGTQAHHLNSAIKQYRLAAYVVAGRRKPEGSVQRQVQLTAHNLSSSTEIRTRTEQVLFGGVAVYGNNQMPEPHPRT